MRIIKPENWIPSDGINLENAADNSVRSVVNTLVVAGPGAGKTELLAQKASYLFQTNLCSDPRKILAISFKTDAASNLKERVIKRCGKEIESRFVSVTYDAFSKSILDHFRFALPEEYRPASDYAVNDDTVIDAAFKRAGYNNPMQLNHSKLKNQYEIILSSVSFPFTKEGLSERVWKLLLKGFDDNPAALTFKMMNILAIYIIRTNPKIKKCLQITYQHVFLDEFQDTTGLQYDLVKSCFKNSSSLLTAVGDNKQRIMLWAGALKTVFTKFQSDFGANKHQLLMNHRSAPKLVELQRMMYTSLEEPDVPIKVSDKWSMEDGKVSLLMTSDEDIEAEIVASDILQKINAGRQPNELCVLCKQTPDKYTFRLIERLRKYNICARIENEYQDLLKEPIIELLMTWLNLAINRKSPKNWELILNTTVEFMGADADPTGRAYSECQTKTMEELDRTEEIMQRVTSESDFSSVVNNVIAFLGESNVRATFPQYSQGTYLADNITKFKKLFWVELASTSLDWSVALENFEGLHSVPIMTIHKSKGLEYETVYFVGLEDAAFWNFKNQPQEDRCAFFVALSRAKSEVVFTYSDQRSKTWNMEQSHENINEFFELLSKPNVANVVDLRS